ncbi:MAG: nucleoside phosphorylase [Deltaproteobacteria bacterium]|nr:nucleoside phosphorylase [Deltaproteobacteria bacterium]
MAVEEPAQPITGLRRGDLGENVFLCGDPARVARISAAWSDVESVCDVREYRIVTGESSGVRMCAASTGIGAPSTAILVEELAKIGVRNLIRVGNSGGLAPELELGDLVITTGSVRDDGTTTSYVAPEYPAVASHEVVSALVEAARARGVRFTTGVSWSLDAFYARNAVLGEGGTIDSMSFEGFTPPGLADKIETYRAARVQNMEMESGAVLTLAGLFGLRAGCICVVSDRTPWPGPAELDIDKNMDACIAVANDAMRMLVER